MAWIVQIVKRECVVALAPRGQARLGGVENPRTGIKPMLIAVVGKNQEVGLVGYLNVIPGPQSFREVICFLGISGPEITKINADFFHARWIQS